MKRIFSVSSQEEFNALALEIFEFQSRENPVYAEYLKMLGKQHSAIRHIQEIPFLPVEFFRHHRVFTGQQEPELVFESSGTTSETASRHFILDPGIYRKSLLKGFEAVFGDPAGYCILALLPSYLERENSSLVFMADQLIRSSAHPLGGFYLDNLDQLSINLKKLEQEGQPSLLLGVSFALAELAENFPMKLASARIIETGGMKGRRREMTREELHRLIRDGLGVEQVCSEYGMTELLSQAWSTGKGIFHCPTWMKVFIRDPYDPLEITGGGSSGGINIIDLANIYSCSFLSTQDIGRINPGDGFEVLGRFDNSDLRGCNLMLE